MAMDGTTVAGADVVLTDGDREYHGRVDADGTYLVDVPPGSYHPYVRGDHVLSLGRVAREQQHVRPQPGQAATARWLAAPRLDVFTDVPGTDLDVIRSAVVRGVVRDDHGRALAGVLIHASPESDANTQPIGGRNDVMSAADGTFELELAATEYQLTPYHDEYSARERPVIDLVPGDEYPIELIMTTGCIVSGRVVGDGAAGGGLIGLMPAVDSPGGGYTVTEFGPDGRFQWSIDEETSVALWAVPWKGAESELQTFQCRAGARHHPIFELPTRAPTLAGRVVTADGTPVAGARIDITGIEPTPNEHAGMARTDASGAWAGFGYPAPDVYDVVARVPGRGLATARVTPPATDITLRLSGTGALTGRTTGIVDGTFTLEATCLGVRTYPADSDTSDRVLVAVHDGRYDVAGLPACKARIVARNSLWRGPEAVVDIGTKQVATLDLDLRALISKQVYGVVRDAGGAPVVGAQVNVIDQRGLHTATDGKGEFEIRGAPGARLRISHGGIGTTIAISDSNVYAETIEVLIDRPRRPARGG